MSDIHGHYKEFMQMLDKIAFSDDDELFILGDVIDRGPLPITLLLYVLNHPNITLLMGNHEQMLLDAGKDDNWGEHTRSVWLAYGGTTTEKQLSSLDAKTAKKMMQDLRKLPYYKFIEVNEKKYLLSHAGVCIKDNEDIHIALKRDVDSKRILWNRHELLLWKNTSDVVMVHGHTPSGRYHPEHKFTIYSYEGDKKINIDCGCSCCENLGCLRLDDMTEFYVPCQKIWEF